MLFSREDFQAYLDCFNEKRYDDIVSYFGEDCVLYYMDAWTTEPQEEMCCEGKQAFIENYKNIHKIFDEGLRLGVFMASEEALFVELYTEFRAKEDIPYLNGELKKGEIFYINQYIDYDLHPDGKFARIRIAQ